MARASNIAKVFGGPAYENLANAVVYLACEDWRLENKWLHDHRRYSESRNGRREEYERHLKEKDEIEHFFLSSWFRFFTTIDPIWLLDNLEHEDELPQVRPFYTDKSKKNKRFEYTGGAE